MTYMWFRTRFTSSFHLNLREMVRLAHKTGVRVGWTDGGVALTALQNLRTRFRESHPRRRSHHSFVFVRVTWIV